MNYTLSSSKEKNKSGALWSALKGLLPLLGGEKKSLLISLGAILINSASLLLIPIFIGRAIDIFIPVGNMRGILAYSAILLGIFVAGLIAGYIQTKTMGGVGRRVLFQLRNKIFIKLQDLPVAFFNQNKAGDLISRINNDTDKLNQFFSQALMQFVGSFFLVLGTGIFLVSLNPRLGTASLLPAVAVLIITQVVSGWVKKKNTQSLQTLGGMSSEIQESLENFKVIVAFNRLDYFRQKFDGVNQRNYSASVRAGLANGVFPPLYGFASGIAQLVVVAYGVYLVSSGSITLGLLVGFLLYVNNFYNPLRQLATVWSSLQLASAALDRVSEVLALESNMPVVLGQSNATGPVLAFHNVSFSYPDGKEVLRDITFELEQGKTYALVGPTGGGKTTTASLMARLYDPSEGTVTLTGRDIRSYEPAERAKKIGFILQEPFLFSGTVGDNIFYGNEDYENKTPEEALRIIEERGLSGLLSRFAEGLETPVTTSGNSISLGQKQIIAFMRATLRQPQLLILDEATANIDTVTEQLLQEMLDKLPATTTRVIIAHRLNTISNADQIFFVNSGEITPAGSMKDAVEMLTRGKRAS